MASFVSLKIFAAPARSFAPNITREGADAALASLTRRRQEILEHILRGQANKVIAALGISQRTAEDHAPTGPARPDVEIVFAGADGQGDRQSLF